MEGGWGCPKKADAIKKLSKGGCMKMQTRAGEGMGQTIRKVVGFIEVGFFCSNLSKTRALYKYRVYRYSVDPCDENYVILIFKYYLVHLHEPRIVNFKRS